MIDHFEAPKYLERHLPGFHCPGNTQGSPSIYQVMHCLLDYTGKEINARHFKTVKTCFAVAEHLYENGDLLVKNAVENSYVYSFTNLLHNHPKERNTILSIVPITLYSLYIRQCLHPGC